MGGCPAGGGVDVRNHPARDGVDTGGRLVSGGVARPAWDEVDCSAALGLVTEALLPLV